MNWKRKKTAKEIIVKIVGVLAIVAMEYLLIYMLIAWS